MVSVEGYPEYLAEDRRRAMLHILKDAGGHANERVMLAGLHYVGHASATAKSVAEDLDLFEKAGLITVDWANETIRVAHLTQRGLDCHAGRVQVKGIKRPAIIG